MNRRDFLCSAATASALAATHASLAASGSTPRTWISTTESATWRDLSGALRMADAREADVYLQPQNVSQTIEGFGACFHELGAKALNALSAADRDGVMAGLFAPGTGANLSLCRMPIAANDFALDWYSYNEHDGDFAMQRFSIGRDEKLLIPFIQSALARRKDLQLWASPWSPPSWMKYNRHYAMAVSARKQVQNGLKPEQAGAEGRDMFIQEPRYFDAYALYFRKFIDAYAQRGIRIGTVMPQNEFNSAQIFPSCCWTPQGLARFIPVLGKALEDTGTDIFFGTLERPDPALFETVFADPAAGKYVRGVGVQWAGKGAVPFIHHAHPQLRLWQSEQECGDGANDWRYARYVWRLMAHYFANGATAYDYWNIALPQGGLSTWGWHQNSLLGVDLATGAYRYHYEYFVLRHWSQFIQRGAKRIHAASWTGYTQLWRSSIRTAAPSS
ncbi:MAG TPA: hypothetical protein VIT67_13975 [Povalibacter sp.]